MTIEKNELHFNALLSTYNLKEEDVDFETYKQLTTLTIAACNEEQKGLNEQEKQSMAYDQAFKLAALFENYKNAAAYLERFKQGQKKRSHSTQLVHDACLFNLPEGNLRLWRGLINHYHPNKPEDKLMQLLSLSKEIEDYVASHKTEILENMRKDLEKNNVAYPLSVLKTKEKNLLSPKTPIATLLDYANNLCYKRASENPRAAALFFANKVSESYFEEYLNLNPVDSKAIPEMFIDGSAISPAYADYYLKKLPSDDPRAALLGHYTSCCQSLNRAGASSVIHGITNEKSGFYILSEKKTDKIVGQCWAWRNEKDEIVFDSVESNLDFRGKNPSLLRDMFAILANELVVHHKIPRVYVGAGGTTPKELGLQFTELATFPVNYNGYTDARTQRLLMDNTLSLLPFYCKSMDEGKLSTSLKQFIPEAPHFTRDTLRRHLIICALNQKIADNSPLSWQEVVNDEQLRHLDTSREECLRLIEVILKYKAFLNKVDRNFPDRATLAGMWEFLSEFKFDLNKPFHTAFQKNTRLLAMAVQKQDFAGVQFLLTNGADIHWIHDESGGTLLHFASEGNFNYEMMNCLIEHGIDLKIKSNNNRLADIFREIPDFRTFRERVTQCVKMSPEEISLKEEYDNKLKDFFLSGIQDFEAFGRLVQSMRSLSNRLNDLDMSGYNAMHYATKFGPEAIAYILSNGGNVNVLSENEETPLIYAIKNRFFGAVQYLIENGATINSEVGVHPLAAALLVEDKVCFQYLLEMGAMANTGNPFSFINLKDKSALEQVQLLIEAGGAQPDAIMDPLNNNTLLHSAVLCGNIDLIKYLIEVKEADINCLNKRKQSPLHLACQQGLGDIIRFLLKKGADTNLVDENKKSAIKLAKDPNILSLFSGNDLRLTHSTSSSFFRPSSEETPKYQNSNPIKKPSSGK